MKFQFTNSKLPLNSTMQTFFREHWFIIIITVIAGLMRFYQLSGKSFWVDEIIATLVSSRPLDRIFAIRATDVTPPLRDYLAHLLFLIFGKGEFALRLPSAFFGTASIPLLYFIGKKWLNKPTGVIAAILLTSSPFHLQHSQDGRMYPMFIFFSLATLVFLLSALQRDKSKHWFWLGFIIMTILNIYTTYFAFWVLITEIIIAGVWLIWQKIEEQKTYRWYGKQLLGLGLSLIIIGILYLPWLPVLGEFIEKNIHAPLPYKYTFKVAPGEKEIANMLYPFRVWFGQDFFQEMLEKYGVPGWGAYIYLAIFLGGVAMAFDRQPKFATVLTLWVLVP
ncbi:MAG: glycosyltransferase family 39 protein, partial [bacterium]|nr:glycosyltransferase family 39 protein [bacterium]